MIIPVRCAAPAPPTALTFSRPDPRSLPRLSLVFVVVMQVLYLREGKRGKGWAPGETGCDCAAVAVAEGMPACSFLACLVGDWE
jgi:hypothetical protein